MGYSAFDPIALADVRSVKNSIDMAGITSDVFTVGDVIRYDPANDTYLRAMANNETNANYIGVVESISGTNFVVVYSGEISLPDSVMSTISGYTGAQVFYLSGVSAGKLTTTQPTNPGHIIKPVIITSGTVIDGTGQGLIDGVVVNSAGNRITGDSIVDLSDIQPVGSVLAFAGNTGQIPNGWDICDGNFLDTTTYLDLYNALNGGKLYGFIQQATITKVSTSGLGVLTNNNIVGAKIYFEKANGTIEATIVSGTISGNSVIAAELSINPAYILGLSAGEYHNTLLQLNDAGRVYFDGQPQDMIYTVSSWTVSQTPTKFKKPDMRSRFILGSSRGITGLEASGFNTYTIGRPGGEEVHTLTIGEIPIHTHTLGITATLSGNVATSHNLITSSAGAHHHYSISFTGTGFDNRQAEDASTIPAIREYHLRTFDIYPSGNFQYGLAVTNRTPSTGRSSTDGAHAHQVTGNISVSTNDLTPEVSGTIANAGGDIAHNNVPQHVVMYWIIKTRKDSYAKLYKLGPSGGGAVIAKNTAKRWARATAGAGCTVDASYGTWGVTRIGQGHYEFYHDLLSELGTADQTKYIVEVAVTKGNSGATQMFIGNPYGYQGMTFGVRVYDIMGTTFSDHFQYINLTVYGGGTAL